MTNNNLHHPQTQDLKQLQEHLDALDNFFERSSLNKNTRLMGCIEKLHHTIERMEQQLSQHTNQANKE